MGRMERVRTCTEVVCVVFVGDVYGWRRDLPCPCPCVFFFSCLFSRFPPIAPRVSEVA